MAVDIKQNVVARAGRMDDLPAVVELTNICTTHAIGGGTLTVTELTEQWSRAMFEPERDSQVIFAPDGALVAAAEFWSREPYVYPYFWGAVHPDYRGQGYGSRLMDWAATRARRNLELAPPEARVAIRVNAVNTEADSLALFARHGYVPARHFWQMEIEMAPDEVPAPQWAEGIRVRTYVPGQDDRPVHEAVEAAFRDHWGYMPLSFEDWMIGMVNIASFEADLWFLAVADTPEGEQIAGVSLCKMGTHDDPDAGYVMDLGIVREYRRRGIALALLHHSFAAFHQRGVLKVALGVDAASLTGATRLYEKAGMHVARQQTLCEKVLREGEDLSTQAVD
ncbi:MAG: GNAT family N-acetyltransferase [Anaerolineae bacterium]|nr:GNAT family N-acetyltransferase [Anaerolineae bacterium]